jgi:hypothetical protein
MLVTKCAKNVSPIGRWVDLSHLDLLHVTGDTANGIISAGRYCRNYVMNCRKLAARSLNRNKSRPDILVAGEVAFLFWF